MASRSAARNCKWASARRSTANWQNWCGPTSAQPTAHEGILRQIQQIATPLIAEHGIGAIGFGFGGPVDVAAGRVVKSHHVDGWNGFPLADWCRQTLGLPAAVANDSDMAGLGEARFGAGRGVKVVFYTNVGQRHRRGSGYRRARVCRRRGNCLGTGTSPAGARRRQPSGDRRVGVQRLGDCRRGAGRRRAGRRTSATLQVLGRAVDRQDGGRSRQQPATRRRWRFSAAPRKPTAGPSPK